MAKLKTKKTIGLLLCFAAIIALATGWVWVGAGGVTSTDNAYVRGDVTSLAPKVAGYVTEIEVEDNQLVRAGEILFRIDDRDYRARLAQATANIDAAIARLSNINAEIELQHSLIRQAEAQRLSSAAEVDLATKVSHRRRDLIRDDAVSQEQVDEADAARLRAEAGFSAASAAAEAQRKRIAVLQAQHDAATAAVAQAEAARELAQIDLDNTIVRAPIAGVVGNRQVRRGRLVAPGSPLLDIVPVQELWVVANFKEVQIKDIAPGQRVRIWLDAYPSERFDGVVDSFAPGSGSAFSLLPTDNATGNFVRVVQRVPIKILFVSDPSPPNLVPGLSARVEIDRGRGQ